MKTKDSKKKVQMGEYIKVNTSFDFLQYDERQTMKGFYLYLPSNTKHMGNTPREFIVPLAQPYELISEWEVGLMEIQYAKT